MNTSKKIISLLMCMLMVLTMVPMSVFAVEATEIDTINIEGLPVPLYGQTVEEYYTAILDERGGGTLTVNDEAFDNTIGKYGNLFDEGLEVKKNDTVLSSTSTELITEGNYYVVMTLYPADGYVIPDDAAITVDGAVSVETDFDEYGALIVYAKFEVKATEIGTVQIEGVPAPLYGQTVEEYNTVMRAGSMNGTHKINGSTRVNVAEDIFYGNIEVADWEYYNSEKSYIAPSSADILPSVYYLVHWLYPAAGYKFPVEVAVTVDGAVSVETKLDEDGCLAVWAKFEVAPPTEIDTIHIEGLPAPLYGQTGDEYVMASVDKHKNGELKVNGNIGSDWMFGNVLMEDVDLYDGNKNNFTGKTTTGTYYAKLYLSADDGYVIPDDVAVTVDGAVSVEKDFDEYGSLIAYAKFEVKAIEITSVELTVSGYQCGGYANQITFTGSEGIYMIPSTYPVFTDINDFEGTALDKYDGFCRDTEYWVSAAFAAADGYALPELSKDDITLKDCTVLDKYVSYDATEQTIWVAFKLSAHSFDDDSDNTCNLCNKERYTYTEADGKVTITAYNGLGGAVNIPSTLGTNGYPVTVIGEEAFSENYGITSVSIPDSVTTIEEDAFYDNKLTSIHIGKGVTSIGEDAFAFSEGFETITVDEDNDYYLSENNVLFDIDKEELIVYAVKKTDTSYTVPATVKKIHRAAFNFAKNLKSITISDGVTDIASFAFAGCKNITSLIIPNSVTSIGSYAFSQMDNLKYVIISDKLTTVSSYAFQFCGKLTDVVIPASVTSIEGGAFRYCPSLSDIYYTGTQAQWENVAVNNNSGYHDKFLSTKVHYNAQVVDGHVYDNDCDAECNLCTEIRTAPHTYEDVITKATLTADGKIESKCSVCGDVKSTVTVYYPKTIKLSSAEVTYNGKVRSPSVTVKDSKGNTLVEGTDYDVTVPSGRKNPGIYKYVVTFKGNYEGEKTLKFTINPETVDVATIKATQSTSVIKLTWGAVEGATGYRVYQYSPSKGKYVQIASVKGVTSYRKATNLKAGTEYKFKIKAYTKLSDGTVLWATASKEFLTATECKAPSITSVTSPSKSKATVKWSNVDGETGYQLYYSTKKTSGFKKVSSYAADKLIGSKTFSSSASGKTIYFKVRAYQKVNGQTIFSEWSAVKSVKLK